MTTLRLTVLGEPRCGKTSLIIRFTQNSFNLDTEETIESVVNYSATLDGDPYSVSIHDCPGFVKDESSDDITRSYISASDAFLVILDASKADSFIRAKELLATVREVASKKFSTQSVIVVATKIDKLSDRGPAHRNLTTLADNYPTLIKHTAVASSFRSNDRPLVQDIFDRAIRVAASNEANRKSRLEMIRSGELKTLRTSLPELKDTEGEKRGSIRLESGLFYPTPPVTPKPKLRRSSSAAALLSSTISTSRPKSPSLPKGGTRGSRLFSGFRNSGK